MHKKREVYILGAARTPFGKFFGFFKDIPAPRLAASAIRAIWKSIGLPTGYSAIDGVVLGQVLPAGVGQYPAKEAALFAGLSNRIPASLVNKVCASSLYAIQIASREIQLREANLMIAGGMENMSRVPYLLERVTRTREFKPITNFEDIKAGEGLIFDGIMKDGLCDSMSNFKPMGLFADNFASSEFIYRGHQEGYAMLSFQRAMYAQNKGLLAKQIGATNDAKDECLRHVDLNKMERLMPAFSETGTVTAATSSQISDGAAVLLLGHAGMAKRLGISQKIRLVDFTDYSQGSMLYVTSPVGAIENLLERNRLTVKDIDLFEINEAFAVIPIYAMRKLGIPHKKLNIWGGAIALGHPLGASGARIVMNLSQQLIETGSRYGIACACYGGGGAMAVLIENNT